MSKKQYELQDGRYILIDSELGIHFEEEFSFSALPSFDQCKDSPEFEFLMPDKKTKASLKDVIPDSRKSAESAITRKGVPVEYEDFVKSYFISLLDEMKKNTNKGENK